MLIVSSSLVETILLPFPFSTHARTPWQSGYVPSSLKEEIYLGTITVTFMEDETVSFNELNGSRP